MKIVLAYICVTHGTLTRDFASRFVGSYLACPPEIEHDLVVVCNGGPLDSETAMLFAPFKCQFLPRENDPGYDIGAYQDVAKLFPSDFQICFGESVYFHRPGWGARLVEVWKKLGQGMYGCFSSNLIRAHLNTTAFAVDQKYLRGYPKVIKQPDRYEFEHGKTSLWRRIRNSGGATKLVTWDGIWEPHQWRIPPNILTRGDQSNCLCWCNHTDRWRAADPKTKQSWSEASDSPFQ